MSKPEKVNPPPTKISNRDAEVGGAVAILTERPSYLPALTAGTQARGAEDVTADDLIIPRLDIVQALSPARDEEHSAYIDGAREGMMYNNVTRALYPTVVLLVPVIFRKQWLVWKDRKKGGTTNSFRGAFDSQGDAERRIDELEKDGDRDLEIIETPQHICLLLDSVTGRAEEIVVSMARTKAKVSKRWNSLMRLSEGDTFSRVYKMFTASETNAQNQKFFNFSVEMAGYVPEAAYKRAEELYKQVIAGRRTIDVNFDAPSDAEKEVSTGEY